MLKEDIRKVKDQGKLFDRLSSDYNIGNKIVCFEEISSCLHRYFVLILALQKNADASKMKRKFDERRNTCRCH